MSRLEPDDETTGWTAERYAAGHMSEQEERDFEVAMLESPALADQVNAAQGLRAGLRELQTRGALSSLMGRTRFPVWHAALAAAAVLLVIGAGVLFFGRHPQLPGPRVMASSVAQLSDAARVVTASFIVAHTRSQTGPISLTLTRHPGAIDLKILPQAADTGGDYQVTLASTDPITSIVPVELHVRPDPAGFIHAYLDPTVLAAGDYRITVIQGPHTEQFPIRVSFPQSLPTRP